MKTYLMRVIVIVLLLNGWNFTPIKAQDLFASSPISSQGLVYPVYIYACVAADGVDLRRAKIVIVQTKPGIGVVWEKYADKGGEFPEYVAAPVPESAGYYCYTVTISLPDGRVYINTNVRVYAGIMDPKTIAVVFPRSMAAPFCFESVSLVLKPNAFFRKPE